MFKYCFKRICLIIPTLIGITLISFLILNLAPGGPIEQKIRQMKFSSMGEGGGSGKDANYTVPKEVIEALKKQYGFDKPLHIRYFLWLKNIATLEFGESFVYEEPVLNVIKERFPVSLQFGIVNFLLIYLLCIPLGLFKAIKSNSYFDTVSSFVLFIMYSIPPLIAGIIFLVFFSGGYFLDWFPLGGFHSDYYDELTVFGKIIDRIHHFVLPLLCYMLSNFTILTILMKNSILDVSKLDYVRTAKAKGLSENVVMFKHAFRNALIPIITTLSKFLGIFFSGSIIIEQMFNLDGIGLLSYKALLDRDYNVIMALIFITSFLLLLGRLISDLFYVIVDPRIDFND